MNNVLVIGDIICDKYVMGKVSRISPEAPVPIVKVIEEKSYLGGAANVANNLNKLSCRVSLCGIIGNDSYGKTILNLLNEENISNNGIMACEEISTIAKVRIVDNDHQIARVDINDENNITHEYYEKILSYARNEISKVDVIVISDYGKGVCSEKICKTIIELAMKEKKVIMVDPYGEDFEKYNDATYIFPNIEELSKCLSKNIKNTDFNIFEHSKKIFDMINVNKLIVTRSEYGISIVSKDMIESYGSTAISKKIKNVVGAGDTVIAVFAAFIGHLNLGKISVYANNAASKVVMSIYTDTADFNDCIVNEYKSKFIETDEIKSLVEKWRVMGEKVVFTNGCFDLLHRGHISLLLSAKALGTKLIVAINSDKSIKGIKGESRPINSERDRIFALSVIEYVDAVVVFSEDTPLKLISKIMPDVLVKGSDYKMENVIGSMYAKETKIIKNIEGYSSSNIIEKILCNFENSER